MGLLDVNALVALARDRHFHHVAIHERFDSAPERDWAACPVTEAGFVRTSANPEALVDAVSIDDARAVLGGLRAIGGHRFVADAVSMTDAEVPRIFGHRKVTDALLLGVARCSGISLVTFDIGLAALARHGEVELLGT